FLADSVDVDIHAHLLSQVGEPSIALSALIVFGFCPQLEHSAVVASLESQISPAEEEPQDEEDESEGNENQSRHEKRIPDRGCSQADGHRRKNADSHDKTQKRQTELHPTHLG